MNTFLAVMGPAGAALTVLLALLLVRLFVRGIIADYRAKSAEQLSMRVTGAACNCYYWTLKLHQCKELLGQPVTDPRKA